MKIAIETKKVDAARVRKLVRVAFKLHEVDGPDVEVHVKRHAKPHYPNGHPRFSGMAYRGVPHVAQTAQDVRYLVTLRVCDPETEGYPFEWAYHKAKTATSPWIQTWEEALVYLAGHEARHVRQFQAKLPLSEVDAEAGGMMALTEYRRYHVV